METEKIIQKILNIPQHEYIERGQFNKAYFEKALREVLNESLETEKGVKNGK